jgi:hypothetical protein
MMDTEDVALDTPKDTFRPEQIAEVMATLQSPNTPVRRKLRAMRYVSRYLAALRRARDAAERGQSKWD